MPLPNNECKGKTLYPIMVWIGKFLAWAAVEAHRLRRDHFQGGLFFYLPPEGLERRFIQLNGTTGYSPQAIVFPALQEYLSGPVHNDRAHAGHKDPPRSHQFSNFSKTTHRLSPIHATLHPFLFQEGQPFGPRIHLKFASRPRQRNALLVVRCLFFIFLHICI
jgi:hypothetical protein